MIKIDFLKNHPQTIPTLAHIWHDLLGKIWMPEIPFEEIESLYYQELNQEMPSTHVAFYHDIPVGSSTLQLNDELRPDLGPWLSDLVVDPQFQKQGIGKLLLDVAVNQAKNLGYKKMYLFTFAPTIPKYYKRFGWQEIGIEEFKSHPVTLMMLDIAD